MLYRAIMKIKQGDTCQGLREGSKSAGKDSKRPLRFHLPARATSPLRAPSVWLQSHFFSRDWLMYLSSKGPPGRARTVASFTHSILSTLHNAWNTIKNFKCLQAWWYKRLISAFKREAVSLSVFQTSLIYRERSRPSRATQRDANSNK